MSIAEKLTTVAENVPKVYKAGQNDILRALTADYTRKDYEFAFQYTDFSGVVFEQKIEGTGFPYAFKGYKGTSLPGNLDFSKCTNFSYTHLCRGASNLLVFPDLNIPTAASNYNGAFQFTYKLHTIEKIGSNENTKYDATFDECTALQNISFNGVIGQNIMFNSCTKLTKASIKNVFDHLSDTASGKTLTLSGAAVTSAFGSTTATEWTNLVATKSNWTITLA